ncbi:MAG TPA: cobalt ECF transporter T component CbiQ [Acidimicrobiales bacterium]|nr:cobalt ECF transporter T component CbiQ [Acidimicrobiales bacterium]
MTLVAEPEPTGPTVAPDWLVGRAVGLCPCGCIGRRRRGAVLARTIDGAAGVTRQAMTADETATRDGLLQRLDPRTKLVGLLVLLLVASLCRSLVVLAVLYLLTVALAAASTVPVWSFVKRVWLFVPLFTAVVVVPATLNLVTPGHVVVPLGTWFGHPVGVTAQGLRGAALLTARVATSVSLAVLVTVTSSWPRLLSGLRDLHVPRSFVMVAAMAHRYVFHLADTVTDVYTARRARTVRPESTSATRRFVGASAGVLFGKASHLTSEVHLAMVARGYTGESRSLRPSAFRAVDAAALLAVAGAGCLMLVASRAGFV